MRWFAPRIPEGAVEDGRIRRPVHIVASPFKTGTSSVGQALLDLGVGTRGMAYAGPLLAQMRPRIGPLNRLAQASDGFRDFAAAHGDRVVADLADLVTGVAPYDVFHDAPFGHTHIHPFLRKVLAPEARFIWVNRDPDDWLASVRNWEENHPEVYPRHADWQRRGARRGRLLLRRWREGHRDFRRLRRAFPDDCLELNWSDLAGFGALARFYGLPAPDRPFPSRNVSRRG